MSLDAAFGPLAARPPEAGRAAGALTIGVRMHEMHEIDQGQLLASIAATSHDCILSVDASGRIVWASPATEQVLGWRPEDLAGQPLETAFPEGQSELREAA